MEAVVWTCMVVCIYSVTPPCGHLVITANFICPSKTHNTFSSEQTPLMRPPRPYGQRPHSENPTCIIVYNFTPIILPLKPVMFIFSLLIFHTLIIHFFTFYVFVHNRSVLDILPNFNVLRTLQRAFFGPLFPRILRRH